MPRCSQALLSSVRAVLAAGLPDVPCLCAINRQAKSSEQYVLAARTALTVLDRRLHTPAALWQGSSASQKQAYGPRLHAWQTFHYQHWSSAALPELAAQTGADDIVLTESAIQRVKELLAESPYGEKFLRLTVEAGGCSGFSYKFDLGSQTEAEDRVYEHGGVQLVVDDVSLEFVKGATIDFVQELIKSTFEVVHNPNAEGGCGCGSSFNPK